MSSDITLGLVSVERMGFPVWTTPGEELRARTIAERAGRAITWLAAILEKEPPEFNLFVVDEENWPRVADIPIYGMPHAIRDKVVTSAHPAPFWNEIIHLISPTLPANTKVRLESVYGSPPDLASLFPDLVVVHEIAHLFHDFDEATGQSDFPRLWLAELFANIALHGYIATVEPQELPVLETVCLASREVPPSSMPISRLDDMGNAFSYPNGAAIYCWFEFVLLAYANDMWAVAGTEILRAFYDRLRSPGMSDQEIQEKLDGVHPLAGRVLREWLKPA